MVLFARSVFSSSPPPVRTRKPAYMIIMMVMIAMNPLRKTIIFAMRPSDPDASNTRLVQSVEIQKIVFPPHCPPP